MPSTFRQDFTFALRQFRRSPGFTVTVILTLALGIGATTAIFSLVDGVLLRPLAFPDVDRLVGIKTMEYPPGVSPNTPGAGYPLDSSYPNFFDWRRQNQTFESLASYDPQTRLFSKANGEGAQVIEGGRVSSNLFSTLGVKPALGRDFTAEDELPGHRVVILSHELWVSLYASSPDVIGQIAKISDEPSIIIGVMPAGFHYITNDPGMFWATYAADAEGATPRIVFRDWDSLSVVGRLKPGVSPQQALADLNTIQRGLAQHYSENRYRSAVFMQPLLNEAVGDVRPVLSILLASVGMVLLIGCANVAGLLLARSTSRRPEVAVRVALGASRLRIVRQLMIESLLLSFAGGFTGISASVVLLRLGVQAMPPDVPRVYDISIDSRVLAFAVVLSAATALIFGLLPAWRTSRSDPAHTLRDSGVHMTSGRRRNRLHHALVVAETALGFSLLVGSGLLIKSMINIFHLDPGFDTQGTVFFDIALTNKRYPDPAKVPFFDKVIPELAAIPGVEKVAAGQPVPGRGGSWGQSPLTIAGHVYSPDNLPTANAHAVTPGFFETLSIPLLRGRTFTPHDNLATSTPVAIINRSLARRYFPGEDPIGHYFTPIFDHKDEPTRAREIIGIVGDTLDEDIWSPYEPRFFLPYAQNPTHQRPAVVMKVAGDPLAYENAVSTVVARFDRDAPVFMYQTLAEGLRNNVAQPRFETMLVSGFAAIALLLSALGLYAVLSYVVAERMRELGLRIALGATRSNVVRLVIQRALVLACLGIATGFFASAFASKLMNFDYYQVERFDRSIYVLVTVVLLLVSLIAALAPALRAASVDPMRTLREQ